MHERGSRSFAARCGHEAAPTRTRRRSACARARTLGPRPRGRTRRSARVGADAPPRRDAEGTRGVRKGAAEGLREATVGRTYAVWARRLLLRTPRVASVDEPETCCTHAGFALAMGCEVSRRTLEMPPHLITQGSKKELGILPHVGSSVSVGPGTCL